ncbi:orotidine-5'-phosphate decarboxylase [Metallibacterium scheffleri]|uniref:Orotidine 5'-phosphate decarboxylase n=1 Tax=Metallibacterium scheffleri TaxID=993689 RepID=A0A4S3KLX1_9GAMM|nr:orotidine-5'-phosphate decarboxylase [Metallibacterium scheffleri]THD09789.1 orotidine-5'-phosphate decarboxylase [Metallibacterium scheffleri]
MTFMQQLAAAWQRNDSLLCVGLDPEPGRFPVALRGRPDALFEFCSNIVDATADLVCCFKPQIAHFAANRAEDALERLIAHIHARHPGVPVILDAKRGDIGSTAAYYASEAFDRYQADAVTINPYLGGDALAPFLQRADRGAILLCRTSNVGARDLQDLLVDGKPLYQHVALRAARDWNTHGNCALVVGATYPAELAQVRALVGDMPLLVPGVGAQGGDAEEVVLRGSTPSGTGLMVSASRAVLYASSGADYADAARAEAQRLRTTLGAARFKTQTVAGC